MLCKSWNSKNNLSTTTDYQMFHNLPACLMLYTYKRKKKTQQCHPNIKAGEKLQLR